MRRISGTYLSLAAGMLIITSCLSSVRTEDRQVIIGFHPVIGLEVRSGNETEFPENLDFGVWAIDESGNRFMEQEQISFNGNSWSSETPYIWPESRLRFIGFAPYYHDITLEEDGSLVLDRHDPAEHRDGLYITELTPELSKNDSLVEMVFRLATAKIDFRVANGLNSATSVRLEKITLKGVYCSGYFRSSEDPEWTVLDEPEDIVCYDMSREGGSADISKEPEFFGNVIEIIPQQSWPTVEVVYSFRTADSHWLTGQVSSTEELEAEWMPGRKYTYTLTLTENGVKHSTGISSAAI